VPAKSKYTKKIRALPSTVPPASSPTPQTKSELQTKPSPRANRSMAVTGVTNADLPADDSQLPPLQLAPNSPNTNHPNHPSDPSTAVYAPVIEQISSADSGKGRESSVVGAGDAEEELSEFAGLTMEQAKQRRERLTYLRPRHRVTSRPHDHDRWLRSSTSGWHGCRLSHTWGASPIY
jgi:hypothetical protein